MPLTTLSLGEGGAEKLQTEAQVLVLRFCFPSTDNELVFDKKSTEVVPRLATSDKLCLSVGAVPKTLALTIPWFLEGAGKRSLYLSGLAYVPGPENNKQRYYHCTSCWISILKQQPHKRTNVPARSS